MTEDAYVLRDALGLLNQQKNAEAVAMLAGNDHPVARLITALALSRTMGPRVAVPMLEQLVLKHPGFVDALVPLGQLLTAVGGQINLATARRHLEQAILVSPNRVDALVSLGEVNWYTAQIDAAITALARAVELEPANAYAHYVLAQVYGQEGHVELSKEHLSEYARLNVNASKSVQLDLADLATAAKKERKIPRARYPSTDTMRGNFDNFFEREYGKYFAAVPKFIRQDTKFFTLGSCFAREISKSLVACGYQSRHLEVTEAVNTTFANRRLVEWLAGTVIGQAAERIEELVQSVGSRQGILDAFATTDVFIFTMGVAPVFFDRETGEFVMPRPTAINTHALAEKYEFRTSTVEENVANVLHILGFIKSINPAAQVFLTISPVPLVVTFEYESAMIADCVSKSVLRVAADQVLRRGLRHVHYWPSFEIVRWAGGHNGPVFGVDDNSEFHVSEALVRDITSRFISSFKVDAG